jgi:opacity protein-like surface antigen
MRTLPLVLLLSLPAVAAAQSADRAETWEAGIKIMDMSHELVEGLGGSSLDIEGELSWGFFGAYNFNEHFQLSGEFAWSDPDYLAEIPLDVLPGGANTVVTVDAELDVWFTNFKATYNFLDKTLTPFVEIGYGWTSVDSNIQDGPADTGCWWDPWWGYMCASFYDTYSNTLNSWTYALGLRWDMSDSSVLKLSYGLRDTDLDRSENLKQDIYSVDFAWKF